MARGTRYKTKYKPKYKPKSKRGKRYRRKKINKKKVFVTLLIFILFIYFIMPKKKSVQNETTKEHATEVASMLKQTSSSSVAVFLSKGSVDIEVQKLLSNIIASKNLNENNFGFFYYNINEGTYYFYNEDKYFTAASTIKVPVCMLYYDKINSGEIKETDTLLYSSECYEAGNGLTSYKYSVGQKAPVSFLMEQAIVNSDNTALNVLIYNIGNPEYRKSIAKYSSSELSSEFYSSNIVNPSYACDVLAQIYNNSSSYEPLLAYMKKSSDGLYLKKYIANYDVAHKYGSYNGYVHDYGIVYSEDPYLIGVFTKNVSNASDLIAEINKQVLEINSK